MAVRLIHGNTQSTGVMQQLRHCKQSFHGMRLWNHWSWFRMEPLGCVARVWVSWAALEKHTHGWPSLSSFLAAHRRAAGIMWEPHQVVALDLYFLLMPHARPIIQHQHSFLLQLASNFIQLHNYEQSEEFQHELAWNLYIFSQGSHLFKSRNDVGYTYLVGRIPRFFPCANCAVAYRHSFLQWSDYRLWH